MTAAARRRHWRAGLAQVTAAISSVLLAEVIRRIAIEIGTFSIAAANPIAKFPRMLANLKLGVHEGVAMMGVGGAYYGLGADPRALSYVHLLAIAVVFAAVAGTAVAMVSGVIRGRPSVVGASSEAAWRLDDMLVFGALGSCTAFVVLGASVDPGYGRYLTAGIIFGAILSGRVVGRVAQNLRWAVVGRLAAVLGLAAAFSYAAGVAVNLGRPVPAATASDLAGWLESHDLHLGIGSYWAASIVTVESRGSVEVRPVVSPDDIRLVRYNRNSAAAWYARPFQFLVFNLGTPPWGDVTPATAINTFGPPSKSYVVDQTYQVIVWKSPLQVSPQGSSG